MKAVKIIICVLLLAALFCPNVCSETSEEVSPAIRWLRSKTVLQKCAVSGGDVVFSRGDFRDALGSDIEYVTVKKLPDAETGVLMLSGTKVIEGQTMPISSVEYLRFIPAFAGAGRSYFGFECSSEGWEDLTLNCIMTLLPYENLSPTAANADITTQTGIAVFGTLPVTEPNNDSFTCSVTRYPQHGSLKITESGYVYEPQKDFLGEDSFCYKAKDCFGSISDEGKITVSVSENRSGIVFEDMRQSKAHSTAVTLCAENVMTYQFKDGGFYFEPEATVSKIDCLVMLMCGLNADKQISAVTDTQAQDDKYISTGKKGYLEYALKQSWVRLENGCFNPNEEADTATAAYMAACMLSLPELKARQTFADSEKIPDWAYKAMISANALGIVDAENGYLKPDSPLSKETLAKIIVAARKYKSENNIL